MEENKTKIIGAFRTTPVIRRALDEYQTELEGVGFVGISQATALNRILADWLVKRQVGRAQVDSGRSNA